MHSFIPFYSSAALADSAESEDLNDFHYALSVTVMAKYGGRDYNIESDCARWSWMDIRHRHLPKRGCGISMETRAK